MSSEDRNKHMNISMDTEVAKGIKIDKNEQQEQIQVSGRDTNRCNQHKN